MQGGGFDISKFTFELSLDVDPVIGGFSMPGFNFSKLGTKMFLLSPLKVIHQYSCVDAFSLAGATYDSVDLDLSSELVNSNHGLATSGDGLSIYIVDAAEVVYQYSGSDSEDLSTFSFSSNSYNLKDDVANSSFTGGMFVVGDNLFGVDKTTRILHHWSLTGGDISTATFSAANFSNLDTLGVVNAVSVWVSSDGLLCVVNGQSVYHQLKMGVAFNLTSLEGTGKTLLADNVSQSSIVFSEDLKIFFQTDIIGGKSIREYH